MLLSVLHREESSRQRTHLPETIPEILGVFFSPAYKDSNNLLYFNSQLLPKNGKIKRVSSQSCCSTPSHCIYSLPLGFITLEPCDAKTPTSPRKDEGKAKPGPGAPPFLPDDQV